MNEATQYIDWRKVKGTHEQYISHEYADYQDKKLLDFWHKKFLIEKGEYEKKYCVLWAETDAIGNPVTAPITSKKVNELADIPAHMAQTAKATTQPPAGKVFTTSSTAETKPAPSGHNNPPADTPEEEFRRRMADDHTDLITEAEKLAAGKPKPCEDDAYADRLTTFTQKLTKTIARIEEVRKAEKAPVLKQGTVIDGYFNGVKARLEATKLAAKASLDPYMKRKAAAEQAERIAAAEAMRAQAAALAASQEALYNSGRPVEAGEAGRAVDKIEKQADRLEMTAQYQTAAVAQVKTASGASASLRTRTVGEIIDRNALDLEKLRPYLDMPALQKALDMFIKTGGREIKGAVIKDVTETVVR